MLQTLESAYELTSDEEAWASLLLERSLPWLGADLWCFVATYHRDEEGVPRVRTCVDAGAPYDIRTAIDGGTSELDEELVDAVYGGHAAHTLSQIWKLHPELKEIFDTHTPLPTRDLCQITCRSADGQGTLLGAGLASPTLLSDARKMRYTRVAAHVTAAHRLRRALEGSSAESALTDHARSEAVLTSEGKVVHAAGDARSESARDELRRAAMAYDRARTEVGRRNAEESLEAWKALVNGRWTIVDHFDTDGRRYLVAMVNPPELHASLALDLHEAQVAELAALGHSQKFIAYELGIHESAVSRLLKSAMGRLGLKSRVDLAALVRSLPRDPSTG